jgi:hypothetical protein
MLRDTAIVGVLALVTAVWGRILLRQMRPPRGAKYDWALLVSACIGAAFLASLWLALIRNWMAMFRR